MKKWTRKNKADLNKELHYVLSVLKHPVTVVHPDGGEEKWFPPSRIEVSPNFFRSVKCRMCQRCCYSFSKFWTEREFKALMKFHPDQVARVDWEEVEVQVDGRSVKFAVIPETPKTGCPFLDRSKGCLVHLYNPTHCRIPLIKFKNSRGVTRITKEQFGRNWAMRCHVKFSPLSREEFEGWDLEVLDRVRDLASDLGVETHLDWIVRELKRLFPEPVKSRSILSL